MFNKVVPDLSREKPCLHRKHTNIAKLKSQNAKLKKYKLTYRGSFINFWA